MEEINVTLERHEQKLKILERDVSVLHEVQTEIKAMNETLLTLASELKHTNEHLARHERKLDEIDRLPKQRLQQIVTAIISALAGGLISTIIGFVLVT
jgi:chromosome segregation ATPase